MSQEETDINHWIHHKDLFNRMDKGKSSPALIVAKQVTLKEIVDSR
jgi:hypothetical protein